MLHLVIVSKHGVPVFTQKFSFNISDDTISAYASLFEAINTYAKSEIGANVKEIKMEDRVIHIEDICGFSVILIAKDRLPLVNEFYGVLKRILKEYSETPDLLLQTLDEFKEILQEIFRRYALLSGVVYLIKKLKEDIAYINEDFLVSNLPRIKSKLLQEVTRLQSESSFSSVSISVYDIINLISSGSLLSALKLLERDLRGLYEKMLYVKLAILLYYLPYRNLPNLRNVERILNEINDMLVREYLKRELRSIYDIGALRELSEYVKANRERILEKISEERGTIYLYAFIFINVGDLEIGTSIINAFKTMSPYLTCMGLAYLFLLNTKNLIELEKRNLEEFLRYIEERFVAKLKGYEWLLLPKLLLMWNETLDKIEDKKAFLSDVIHIYRFWKSYYGKPRMEVVPFHISLLRDILGGILPFLVLSRYAKLIRKTKEIAKNIRISLENYISIMESMRNEKRIHPLLFFVEEMFILLAYAKSLILQNIFSPKLIDYILSRINIDFIFNIRDDYRIYVYIYLLLLLKILETLSSALLEEKAIEYRKKTKEYVKMFKDLSTVPIIRLLLEI